MILCVQRVFVRLGFIFGGRQEVVIKMISTKFANQPLRF